ncbi:hypothetical protein OCE52_16875 [Bacillus mobilis]|uniref:hypothetical protein n=1 Tax=Bacillus mobilis TaxID=2026190 RepID=UPI0021CE3557|nr:hypothetical protein [Bacillus mobilis]MCU5196478.1 hypothetical protein [Bacillus mobilis]
MKVRLADLEPGKLFRFGDTIGFKSEYRTGGAVEAFIVGSGEMFWGGTDTAEEQRELMVEPVEEKEVTNFQVEDIDGCEFVKVKSLGNALISYDHDFDGFMTGKIQVVYSDGSGSAISTEEAQDRVDSGEWTIIKA